ncbi:MAG: c-type cytochrome [Saprospiraceae bacterium]|nr:c-type cytochrome [Saprospiraceae bacterium]
MKNLTLLLLALALLTQCKKSEQQILTNDVSDDFERERDVNAFLNLPANPNLYNPSFPNYMFAVGVLPCAIDDAKASLGRVLFYDKNLSKDRSVSCASCHKQEYAFSDNVAFSKGVEGKTGARNSMALANVAQFGGHYAGTGTNKPFLLWDNRSNNVPDQATQAFTNPIEMNISLEEVMQRVQEQPYYKHLFKDVYGNSDMTKEQMLAAIGEFVKAIGSSHSKLDKSLESTKGNMNSIAVTTSYFDPPVNPLLDPNEVEGQKLFVANCTSCHSPIRAFQTVFEACNGLDMNYADKGKSAITHNPAHEGVFKSPSLRNIALTAPYMHDGRFKTLEEVVEFYSTGVNNHPNLHPNMVINGQIKRNFTSTQKQQLVAFLKTMTDDFVVSDPRFSSPFK